jgi:hypothetical protein
MAVRQFCRHEIKKDGPLYLLFGVIGRVNVYKTIFMAR